MTADDVTERCLVASIAHWEREDYRMRRLP